MLSCHNQKSLSHLMDFVNIMIVHKTTGFKSLRHKYLYEIPSYPNLLILCRIFPNLILMHYFIFGYFDPPSQVSKPSMPRFGFASQDNALYSPRSRERNTRLVLERGTYCSSLRLIIIATGIVNGSGLLTSNGVLFPYTLLFHIYCKAK